MHYTISIKNIEVMVDSTSLDLNKLSTSSSVFRQGIINTTKSTLDEAKKLLMEADEQGVAGESEKANSSVMESENKAREAKVFLNAVLEVEKRIANDNSKKNTKSNSVNSEANKGSQKNSKEN